MSIFSSVFTGITGKDASKKAQQAQTQSLDKAMAQQQAQFDTTQANFKPFLQAGQQALGGSLDLLGLNGGNPQSAAIAALKASPEFTALYGTGQDTILQNSAATGGLRGGNTQNSLAQFGSSLLGTVIQNHLSNLGGLVNVGTGSAGQLGQFGQANSSAQSNLLTQSGNVQASGILGRAAIQNKSVNDIDQMLQQLVTGGMGGGISF